MGRGRLRWLAGLAPFVVVLAGIIILAAAPAWSEEEAEDETEVDVSLGGSVYEPWDGQTGHGVSLSAQLAFEKRRVRIGIEVEHRRFDGSLESDFSPTYDSILLRGLFHFHPFPEAPVSPYVGIGTGIALHVTDRQGGVGEERKQYRRSVSAGTTLLGLVGVQTRIPGTRRFSFFSEARIETASDVWKKRGSNWRYDQVGGVTGMAGLRARF